MRSLVLAVALVAVSSAARVAVAEPAPPGAVTFAPAAADADDLERSGRHRIGLGATLIAVGVLGWGASTAGTVISIVGYVKDARNECGNGACDTLKHTGTGLSVGGTIAEVGGLAGGIPLLVSGVRRVRAAHRLRVGFAPARSGAGVQLGGHF